jgi:hypothetical protein
MPDAIVSAALVAQTEQPQVQQPAAADAPPKYFTEFVESVNGRLSLIGKDLGKVREKSKGDAAIASDGPSAANAPKAVTIEDLGAAMKLGQHLAKLPAAAAEHVQSMLEQGKSYSEALSAAELIAKFSSAEASSSANQNPAPAAIAASAKPQTSPAWPRTQEELRKLSRENPKLFNELMDVSHPFDFTQLPPR